jgi:hypothetical protein
MNVFLKMEVMMNWLIKFILSLIQPGEQLKVDTVFEYKYQRFPMDDAQFFSVTAESQESANDLAKIKFKELFDREATVMTIFVPVKTT